MKTQPKPDAEFLLELDKAVLFALDETPLELQALETLHENSLEARIHLYQDARSAELLPEEVTTFLLCWAIEALADARIDDLYQALYRERMERIKTQHGLSIDEDWEPGQGPPEYERLVEEFEQRIHTLYRTTYQSFGEHKLCVLVYGQPGRAQAIYDTGYTWLFPEKGLRR